MHSPRFTFYLNQIVLLSHLSCTFLLHFISLSLSFFFFLHVAAFVWPLFASARVVSYLLPGSLILQSTVHLLPFPLLTCPLHCRPLVVLVKHTDYICFPLFLFKNKTTMQIHSHKWYVDSIAHTHSQIIHRQEEEASETKNIK